jgi:hypothetical protein
MLGADLVTADGEFLKVTAENPELLWGLRGGGHVTWVRPCCEAITPGADRGGYANFLAGDDGDWVRAACGPERYECQAAALGGRSDPTIVFPLNQNIRPAASPAS